MTGSGRTRSPWREFAFMHHQVRQWIDPRFDLQYVLNRWPEISNGLAEATRQRELQLQRAFATS
jgi:hypothetical protein